MNQGVKGILDQVTGRARQPMVDPVRFDDPVALETDWNRKLKSQVMFRTHKYQETSSADIVFRSTLAFKITAVMAFLGGGALLSLAIPNPDVWLFGGIGAIIMLVGLYILVFKLGPIGFYGGEQEFHRGRGFLKVSVPFNQIYALQLLTKVARVRNDPHSGAHTFGESTGNFNLHGRRGTVRDVRSQEMNLVRPDGSREHVMTYQKEAEALKDAQVIAGKLGIPVWNGMDGGPRSTRVYSPFR